MMSKECNKLFSDLWWHSDNELAIKEFIEAMKEWVEDWNKGEIGIALIDLNTLDSKFNKGHCYIAYDDFSGSCEYPTIFQAGDFIEYIQEIYNDYAEDLGPEEFWVERLNGILKNYQ